MAHIPKQRRTFFLPLAFAALGPLSAGCSGHVEGSGPEGDALLDETPGVDPVTGQPVGGAAALDPVTGLPAVDSVTGVPVTDSVTGPAVDPVTGLPVSEPVTGTTPPGTGTTEVGTPTSSVTNPRDALAEACAANSGALNIGVTKLRRLSVLQFNNTVQSLLGGEYVDYAPDLPADEPMGPFVSNQSLSVGALEARQYRGAAETVAANAIAAGATFLPCVQPTDDDTACIEQFIDDLAPRAFRRPLDADEAQQLLGIYVLGRNGLDGEPRNVSNGLELLLRSIIGSPNTLYVADVGVSGVASATPEPASAYTLASRLALGFWNAPPDAELTELAASRELLDEAVYSAQVQRVVNDPRAEATMAQIFSELTGVDELLSKEKDASLFPQFDTLLAQQMLDEQASFVKDVVFRGDGRFSTLLTTNYASPSSALADLYGATVSGGEATYPDGERLGLLTQAGYLAAHNKAAETSPVHLGINVREAIMCQVMPPPPADVNTTLPEPTGTIVTSRDRFAQHEENPACASCHVLIDPIGLAFEQYDPIGRFRLTDNGAPIDPTGQIVNPGGTDSPMFTGALELSQQLSHSAVVQDCVSRQVLRSVLDRQESANDACTVIDVINKFDASSGNLKTLIADIAGTEAFKNVLLNPEGTL